MQTENECETEYFDSHIICTWQPIAAERSKSGRIKIKFIFIKTVIIIKYLPLQKLVIGFNENAVAVSLLNHPQITIYYSTNHHVSSSRRIFSTMRKTCERLWQINGLVLYSRGHEFESLPVGLLFWLGFLVAPSRRQRQTINSSCVLLKMSRAS